MRKSGKPKRKPKRKSRARRKPTPKGKAAKKKAVKARAAEQRKRYRGKINDEQVSFKIEKLYHWYAMKPPLLHLRPDYQRGIVWKKRAKSFLLDSILSGWVIPEIYLHKEKRKGTVHYNVVDGQQRLHTIFDFMNGTYTTGNEQGSDFKIVKSEAKVWDEKIDDYVDQEWAGKTFEDLSDLLQKRIKNFSLKFRILPDVSDELVQEVFVRINKNVAKLTDQQLRNAKYSNTEFLKQVNETAEEWNDWLSGWDVINNDDVQLMKFQDIVINDILLFAHNGMTGVSSGIRTKLYEDKKRNYKQADRASIDKNLEKVRKRLEKGIFPHGVKGTRFEHKDNFISLFLAIYDLECGTGGYAFTGKDGETKHLLTDFSTELSSVMLESPRKKEDMTNVSPAVAQYYCILSESWGKDHTTDVRTKKERHSALLQLLLSGTGNDGKEVTPQYTAKDPKRLFTEDEKRIIFAREENNDGYCKCNCCEKLLSRDHWAEFAPDHKIPHALAGKSNIDNAQVLCVVCNQKKSGKSPEELVDNCPP